MRTLLIERPLRLPLQMIEVKYARTALYARPSSLAISKILLIVEVGDVEFFARVPLVREGVMFKIPWYR
jgi:hypothetical protein